MPDLSVALHILSLSARGVHCATAASTGAPFWLPRDRHVAWARVPRVGDFIPASVPDWLAAKHRQLVGDVAYERVRDRNRNTGNSTMADQRDMSGSISKNTRKEKPSHADYTGSIVIEGCKYWLNGWIKDGQNGKFLSLSARPAEASNGQQKRAAAHDDDQIPF
jgi:hypothetical protein